MIKFNDMPYSRPSSEELISNLDKLIIAFKEAKNANEQITLFKNQEKLMASFQTLATLAYVRNSINTKDEFYEQEKIYFDEVSPLIEEKSQEFLEVFLSSKFKDELILELGEIIFINAQMRKKTFSPEIIPLLQEESKLTNEYQKIYAGAIVEFDGKKLPLPLLGPYKQSTNRQTRKAAFVAEGEFFTSHKEEFDEIFDKLVKCRTKQAEILGFKNYVELGYLHRQRNSYNAQDVANFRKQVLADIVPLVSKIKENQKNRIGVDTFTLYDDALYFKEGNADPIGTPDELLAASKVMYSEMSSQTKEFIELMFNMELFDVLSKDGKAPGGFCTDFSDYNCPFIFSNFNGTSADVDVLTHEAGHAFASFMANKEIEYHSLRQPSMESCEVHSMSMEFLTSKWHHLFFKENTIKYQLSHAEGALSFIPYGVMVDYFQELIYSNPNMSKEERHTLWLSLEKDFRPYIDFDNLPFYSTGATWQRQLHIYHYPFYYIDYCLAQIVALQIFALSLEDEDNAFKTYMEFVKLGGTKTFVQLISASGLVSPFENGSISKIASSLNSYIENLTNKI